MPGPDLSLYLTYAGFAIFGTLWIAVHLGNMLAGSPQSVPINPIAIVADLAKGRLQWPGASTVILLLVIASVVAYLVILRQMNKRQSKGRLPVDEKADVMGSGGAISMLTEAESGRKPISSGCDSATTTFPVCRSVSAWPTG